ncbi:hypothetical protein HK096_007960, partial [Nowakowskiella sp. JEL0078]
MKSEIRNWSGVVVLANEDQLVHATSVSDIQSIIKNTNGVIRVIGSGLSYEPLVRVLPMSQQCRKGTLLILNPSPGLLSQTANTATFSASTQLATVFEVLAKMNRMVPCSPGVIGIQTIAGAISTGTHGQGLRQSSLADVVTSMNVVLANAEQYTVSRGHPWFAAFMNSLGALGVITSITVKTEPLRVFTCRKSSVAFETFVNEFVEINRVHEFCKAWWFPVTNQVHVWYADEATPSEHTAYIAANKQVINLDEFVDSSLNEVVDIMASKMAADTHDEAKSGRQFETVDRFRNSSAVVGNLTQVYCKGIPVPQINCEIGVPLENFKKAVALLAAWSRDHGESLHYPFIFRCNGPSDAWLSPSYKRDTCYIGFLVYLAADGTPKEGSFEMMNTLQSLLASVGGIPHLGKHFVKNLYDFPKYLPKWGEFIALRRKLDPHGKFQNDFIGKLFETEEVKENYSVNKAR